MLHRWGRNIGRNFSDFRASTVVKISQNIWKKLVLTEKKSGVNGVLLEQIAAVLFAAKLENYWHFSAVKPVKYRRILKAGIPEKNGDHFLRYCPRNIWKLHLPSWHQPPRTTSSEKKRRTMAQTTITWKCKPNENTARIKTVGALARIELRSQVFTCSNFP